MNKVAVLMSTYNGIRFLREQLDSIMAQIEVEVEIFIRDDGSTDETRSFLENYSQVRGKVHLFFEENVGVGNSFMNLVYSVPNDFDYYAFSDQDDIWQPNKLIEAIKKLQEQQGGLLYASNQENVDRYGNSLGLRYAADAELHLSPIGIMCSNMLAGCTMVWTKDMNILLTDPTHRPSPSLLRNRIHDVWLAMVAAVHNGLVYDPRAFIRYRQHENNVVGAYGTKFSKRLKERMKKVKRKELRCGRSLLAKETIEKFPNISEEQSMLVICSRTKTLRDKRNIVKNKKEILRYSKENKLLFSVKVLFGLF